MISMYPLTTTWRTWVPALTAASTNPTPGSFNDASGRYLVDGKNVFFWASIYWGTTAGTSGNGTYYFSLPVPARSVTDFMAVNFNMLYSSGGPQIVVNAPFLPVLDTQSRFRVQCISAGGDGTPYMGHTLYNPGAQGGYRYHGVYEAA